ncbi:MATE family efflux transporter [Pseudothermotoga sp. U03pept]|uniref:MATE family efflux transporter n=1 Tax=Pseudothermotoga sp. U03pept TaxID=3447012 RepID=UPI003F0C7768
MKYSLLKEYLSKTQKREVRKELLLLGLPSMAENALQMLLGLVDTAFLGHLSWQAMSGVSLANQVFFIFQVVLIAASTGVTVLVSNAVGARNNKMISRSLWNGLYLATIWGLAMMVFVPFIPTILKIFPNVDQQVYQMSVDYLTVILSGILTMSFMGTLSAALRGSGDTKTPMLVAAISNALNIVLDYGMIFGKLGFPRLEAKGAALATVLSRLVGVILLLIAVLNSYNLHAREKQGRKIDFTTMGNILAVGLPTAAENMLFSTGLLLFANILLMAGAKAYAAHRVGINIESISFMPGMGLSVAITALVGRYNGRGELTKIAGVVRQGWILTTIFQVSVGIFIFAFPKLLITLFTNDAEIISIALLPVRLIGLFQAFLAIDYCMNGALRGTGNTSFPMITVAIAMWLIRLPVGYFLVKNFNLGLLGAWIGMMTDIVFRSLIKLFFYLSGRWEKRAKKTTLKVKATSGDLPGN